MALTMIETELSIQTADGHMPTWVVHPDEGGPVPMVLFMMDALGIREELRDMARRIATVGYSVWLPNLYYRDGCPSFDPSILAQGRMDPDMVRLNDSLSTAMTVSDVGSLLACARGHASIRLPAAVIGYCMGGRHAIAAAAAYPDVFAAMASMHGGRLVNDQPDSPHRLIPRMRAKAYFAWADQDAVAPPEHARIVQSVLAEHSPESQLEWHIGALHGFTFPERYCYHKAAAERVWNRLFTLFRRQLDGSSLGKP
ncbi:MAG: hypothetical protein RLZZ153_311 [Pseudomonadota bacterium]|jgi:carboxymethylenebutenolidase